MLSGLENSTVKLRQIKLSNAKQKAQGVTPLFYIAQKVYTKFGIASVINAVVFNIKIATSSTISLRRLLFLILYARTNVRLIWAESNDILLNLMRK